MNDYQNQRRDLNYLTFWDNYEHLCSLQSTVPLQSIKTNLQTATLDINADKLKSCDWDPLLNTVRVSKNLLNIVFTSTYNEDEIDVKNNRNNIQRLKKAPSIRSKEKTTKLCRSLRDCLLQSIQLNKLELQGIPLTLKEIATLAKGLKANKTLKTLSLDNCLIGDEGLAIVCRDIRSSSNLNRVNFSSCKLTMVGAEILAALIKYQAMKRHNEAWKDSLRYGRPDLDSMFGIRRITINSNPLIGDKGAEYLADAFKGDLWLKALDLQDCGITTIGANHLLEGLKFNAMMHVLDVRLNPKIDRDTLQKIMEQVMINSSGKDTEYEWMSLVSTQAKTHKEAQQNKIKKRRTINSSFSKKTQYNQVSNALKMKRCKSTGSVLCNKVADTKHVSGIPWRTAARANRHRNRISHRHDHEFNDEDIEEGENENDDLDEKNSDYATLTSSSNFGNSSHHLSGNKNLSNNNNNDLPQQHHHHHSGKSHHSHGQVDKNDVASNLDKIKSLTVKDLLQVLQREQDSKTQLEYLLIELQQENSKLKEQVNMLQQSKFETSTINANPNNMSQYNSKSNLNKSLLDDDKALEIIELTLFKYQKFLDFLRNAGLGKLITMAELETEKEAWGDDSRFNASTSSIYQEINFNQTNQSLDLSQNNVSILNELRRRNHNSNNNNNNNNKTLDNSVIDTLVNKSLEISRNYRRYNSNSNNNNNNNNKDSSIVYDSTNVQNKHKQHHQQHQQQQEKQPQLQTTKRSNNSNNIINLNKEDENESFNLDRQNKDLQKQTETLLREYQDIKTKGTAQSQVGFGNLIQELELKNNAASTSNIETSHKNSRSNPHSGAPSAVASASNSQHSTAKSSLLNQQNANNTAANYKFQTKKAAIDDAVSEDSSDDDDDDDDEINEEILEKQFSNSKKSQISSNNNKNNNNNKLVLNNKENLFIDFDDYTSTNRNNNSNSNNNSNKLKKNSNDFEVEEDFNEIVDDDDDEDDDDDDDDDDEDIENVEV